MRPVTAIKEHLPQRAFKDHVCFFSATCLTPQGSSSALIAELHTLRQKIIRPTWKHLEANQADEEHLVACSDQQLSTPDGKKGSGSV